MTDKLKCCFCGEELEDDWYEYENGHGDTEYAKSGLLKCPDWDCRGYKLKLEPEIWQALIDGKKARDALKVARNLYQELALAYCEMVDDYRTTYGCLKTPEQETQEYMKEYDEKIASITKQEI